MLVFSQFGGALPRVNPRHLPPGGAVLAENCDFRRSDLRAHAGLGPARVVDKPGALSAYPLDLTNDVWLAWDKPVSVVASMATDANGRIMYSGDGYPKQTDLTLACAGPAGAWPYQTRRLGVLPAAQAPTLTLQGTAGSQLVKSGLGYVYTLVTDWGEESSPSPPSALVDLYAGQTVRLSGFTLPTNSGNNVTRIRIYRLESGSKATADYQYLTEIGASDSYYDDDLSLTSGQVLETATWLPPPELDNGRYLAGLMPFVNGLTCGFLDRSVYFSVPFVPYAWPASYAATCGEPLVGISYFGQTVVALTAEREYRITGQDPGAMVIEPVPHSKGCLAAASIVATPLGVVSAGPDGLYLSESGGRRLLSGACWLAQDWRALGPEGLHGFYVDGAYLGLLPASNTGFLFDLTTGTKVDLAWGPGSVVRGGIFLPSLDQLRLLVQEGTGYALRPWGTGSDLALRWRSRPEVLPATTSFSVAKVVGGFTAPLTLTIYIDGRQRLRRQVRDESAFRLPPGLRGSAWQVELSGSGPVDQVRLASSMLEVRG